jgi:hypothetical protein
VSGANNATASGLRTTTHLLAHAMGKVDCAGFVLELSRDRGCNAAPGPEPGNVHLVFCFEKLGNIVRYDETRAVTET